MPARRTRRKPRNRTLAKRVSRLERVSRPEVKYHAAESGAFDTVGSINGTLILPQQLQEGVGRQSRIGDKVKSRNIRFQGVFKIPDNASNYQSACRLLVLRSKIMDPQTSDMPNWYAQVDEDKFFVIKDMMFNLSTQASNATSAPVGSQAKRITFNVSTGLRKLQYDGAALQSPANNEYVIYMLAENQSLEVAYNWKHYYIDN